jgi:hypothetical protein
MPLIEYAKKKKKKGIKKPPKHPLINLFICFFSYTNFGLYRYVMSKHDGWKAFYELTH